MENLKHIQLKIWMIKMNNDKFPMCPSLKVSPQGQVTIPDNIRQKLGIKAGDRIDITEIVVCKE